MIRMRRFAVKLVLAITFVLCAVLLAFSFQSNKDEKPSPDMRFAIEQLKKIQPRVDYVNVSIQEPFPSLYADVHVHRKTHDVTEGFLHKPRLFSFLKNFKNPCFFENECGCNRMVMTLRCLPYFHVVGFPKTGSTDFWSNLMYHPDMVRIKKESNYWTSGRYNNYAKELKKMESEGKFESKFTIGRPISYQKKYRSLEKYLDRMSNGSRVLLKESFRSPDGKVSKLFGEGSVTYAYSSMGLRSAIGSMLSKPPEKVEADIGQVLKWLTPDAKIIFSLRNPVDRLYSDYRNLFNGLLATEKSKENFHSIVEQRIQNWTECTHKFTPEYCVASPAFEVVAVHTPIIGLVRGMYSIFIRQWLKSFPKEQMHFVRLEDRLQDLEPLKETFKFLDLRPLNDRELNIVSDKVKSRTFKSPNQLKKHQVGQGEPMMEKTRKLLQDFYKPFNEDLAELLNDSRYLWLNG